MQKKVRKALDSFSIHTYYSDDFSTFKHPPTDADTPMFGEIFSKMSLLLKCKVEERDHGSEAGVVSQDLYYFAVLMIH